ncbi:unnamed protein product [Phytophthora fragariaefolia]|uniref:Unnamed protein product n=1 Tax=Phytophthora fragariaefolia TaxID=1490495 RepID=A0A9W6YE39_9STRA|nr:unnamed protein product [Phytophthora fragariaefolia]
MEDFSFKKYYFYGATSDAGADDKSMLRNGLNLRWEWSIAHMVHAATKASCGVNEAVSAEAIQNGGPENKNDKDDFSDHERIDNKEFVQGTLIILKWRAITEWYEERERQALRANKSPPDFPLANRYDDLVHVLSVLKQMGEIKRNCQAEWPVQVEVLAQLFLACIHDLNADQALPHYLSTDENPRWVAASELTPRAAKTRSLLR